MLTTSASIAWLDGGEQGLATARGDHVVAGCRRHRLLPPLLLVTLHPWLKAHHHLPETAFASQWTGWAAAASVCPCTEIVMSGQRLGQDSCDQVLTFIATRLRQAGASFDDADLGSLNFDSVGIDSLELTELIMELEEQFRVIIDDSILSGDTTVSQLAAAIAQDAGGAHGS